MVPMTWISFLETRFIYWNEKYIQTAVKFTDTPALILRQLNSFLSLEM